jgi:hypothetical protein
MSTTATSAILAAHRQIVTALGGTVTFHGADWTRDVPAVVGQRLYQVREASGVFATFSAHDLVVEAALLVRDGQLLTPRRGWRVTRVTNGRRHTFEVQYPDQSRPPFRWSDPQGLILRIHTLLLKDEVAT